MKNTILSHLYVELTKRTKLQLSRTPGNRDILLQGFKVSVRQGNMMIWCVCVFFFYRKAATTAQGEPTTPSLSSFYNHLLQLMNLYFIQFPLVLSNVFFVFQNSQLHLDTMSPQDSQTDSFLDFNVLRNVPQLQFSDVFLI